MPKVKNAPTENLIKAQLHCSKCVDQYPKLLSVGLTDGGKLQVWCERHHVSVAIFKVVKPRIRRKK